MKFSVTDKDIEQGIPSHGSLCPIGRCLIRTFRHNKESVAVRVEHDFLEISNLSSHVTKKYKTNDTIEEFVKMFDSEDPKAFPEPFEFSLDELELIEERYEGENDGPNDDDLDGYQEG